jgi:hypothetical protein
MSLPKDVGAVALGLAMAPVLTALGLASLAVIVGRHLRWWAAGHRPTMVPIAAAPSSARRVS